MSKLENPVATRAPEAPTFSFTASDVTGTHSASAAVQPELPAEAVTDSLVAEMGLPANTPYGLRDEASGEFLDDERPISEQIEPGSRLTVTPRTHLG